MKRGLLPTWTVDRAAAHFRPAVCQVTHLPSHALRDPFPIALEAGGWRLRARNARELETTFSREASDSIGLHLLILAGAILGLKAA